MDLPQLVDAYGLWIVLAGTLLEGETVLLLAGYAAHRGYLTLPGVIGVAVAGSFLGDQFYFYLGRRHGAKLLERFPRFAARAAHAQELIARFQLPIILAMRFLYGLRAVLPFTIGTGAIPTLRFQALDLAGAVLWSCTIASAGYLFGNALELILGDVQRYERIALVLAAVAGFVAWRYTRRRK